MATQSAIQQPASILSRAIRAAWPNRRLVTLGDSNTGNSWMNISSTTTSRTNNVATVTDNSGIFQPMTGTGIRVEQRSDPSFNGYFPSITRISATQFSYPNPGPDVAPGVVTGGIIRSPTVKSDQGWVNHFLFEINQSLDWVFNAGVGGDTTQNMLDRYDAEVAAYKPGWVSVLGAINDVIQGVLTAPQSVANLRKLCLRNVAIGAQTLLFSCMPLGPAHAQYSTANNGKINDINQGIRLICKELPGVHYVPACEAVVDPLNTGLRVISGMFDGSDVHTSWRGAVAVGSAAALVTRPKVNQANDLPYSASDNRAQSASNTNVWQYLPSTNTGGALNGVTTGSPAVPQGFNVTPLGSSTAVPYAPLRTVNADGDALGYCVGVKFTPNAAGDSFQITNQNASHVAYMAVGKSYCWEFDLTATGLANSNINRLVIQITFVVDGVSYVHYLHRDSQTTPTLADLQGVMRSDDFILSGSALSNATMTIRPYASAAGGLSDWRVSRFGLREKLTGEFFYF